MMASRSVETRYPPEAEAFPKLPITILPLFLKSRTAAQIESESTTPPPPESIRRTTELIDLSSPASFNPLMTAEVPNLMSANRQHCAASSMREAQYLLSSISNRSQEIDNADIHRRLLRSGSLHRARILRKRLQPRPLQLLHLLRRRRRRRRLPIEDHIDHILLVPNPINQVHFHALRRGEWTAVGERFQILQSLSSIDRGKSICSDGAKKVVVQVVQQGNLIIFLRFLFRKGTISLPARSCRRRWCRSGCERKG